MQPAENTNTGAISFEDLLSSAKTEAYIRARLEACERNLDDYLRPWRRESMQHAYPSQGLIRTPYDELDYAGEVLFPEEQMLDILRVRTYLLEIFNHPDRIAALRRETEVQRAPIPAVQ